MPNIRSVEEIRHDLEEDLAKWRQELAELPSDEAYRTIRAVLASWIASGDQILASVDGAG